MSQDNVGRSIFDGKRDKLPKDHPVKADINSIEHYIKGIDYPANREKLANYAKHHGAPNEVVDLINNLPEYDYYDPIAVSEGMHQLNELSNE